MLKPSSMPATPKTKLVMKNVRATPVMIFPSTVHDNGKRRRFPARRIRMRFDLEPLLLCRALAGRRLSGGFRALPGRRRLLGRGCGLLGGGCRLLRGGGGRGGSRLTPQAI